MKAVVVFLLGVAVGWMLMPQREPGYTVELEPIAPEPGRLELDPIVWIGMDGRTAWGRLP